MSSCSRKNIKKLIQYEHLLDNDRRELARCLTPNLYNELVHKLEQDWQFPVKRSDSDTVNHYYWEHDIISQDYRREPASFIGAFPCWNTDGMEGLTFHLNTLVSIGLDANRIGTNPFISLRFSDPFAKYSNKSTDWTNCTSVDINYSSATAPIDLVLILCSFQKRHRWSDTKRLETFLDGQNGGLLQRLYESILKRQDELSSSLSLAGKFAYGEKFEAFPWHFWKNDTRNNPVTVHFPSDISQNNISSSIPSDNFLLAHGEPCSLRREVNGSITYTAWAPDGDSLTILSDGKITSDISIKRQEALLASIIETRFSTLIAIFNTGDAHVPGLTSARAFKKSIEIIEEIIYDAWRLPYEIACS